MHNPVRRPGSQAATFGGTTPWRASFRVRERTHKRRTVVHDHLYLRHDWQAQGRAARSLRFPYQRRTGLAHCFDVQPGDVLFWYTDIGWMMGPWAISGALMLGATLFMYDGTPDFPEPDRLWAMVERHGITHLGISPTAIRALMAHGDEWVAKHDMTSLMFLGSTGEPWNPEPWRWYFEKVGGMAAARS